MPRVVAGAGQDVYLMANPENQHVAVMPFGGAAGIILGGGKAVVAAGLQSFTAPSTDDWVLVIRRQ